MPISNNASQSRMTKTTIRIDSREAQRRQQAAQHQFKTVTSTNNANNNDYSSYNNTVVRTQPTAITVEVQFFSSIEFPFYLEYISN